MLDIFRELSLVEVAVMSNQRDHVETMEAWRTVKAFVLAQLRTTSPCCSVEDSHISETETSA